MPDAYAKLRPRFLLIGVLILVSYACYLPVVLFVQRVLILGMLMIPKTLGYLPTGFLAYRDLYGADASCGATRTVTTAR